MLSTTLKSTRFLLLICSFVLALGSIAFSEVVTITWASQNNSSALGTADGKELPSGSLVRLGIFGVSGEELVANASNAAYLEANFIELSRELIGRFGGELVVDGHGGTEPTNYNVDGVFAQKVSFDSAELAGQRLSIWAFNADASHLSTEHAIFSQPDWIVPERATDILQIGLESLDPLNHKTVYLAERGPELSATAGGFLNKLIPMESAPGPDLEDSDGDGVVALLEEAFGMDPGSPDSHLMPEVQSAEVDGMTLQAISMRRVAGGEQISPAVYHAGDLVYSVEVSQDLENWTSDEVPIVQLAEPSTPVAGIERVSFRIADPAVSQSSYLRVRVARLP